VLTDMRIDEIAAVEVPALPGPFFVYLATGPDIAMSAPLQPWFIEGFDTQELAAHRATVARPPVDINDTWLVHYRIFLERPSMWFRRHGE
jgi:hypothetical protein